MVLNLRKVLENKKIKTWLKILNRTPKNCVLCEGWIFYKAPICKACRKYLFREFKKNEFNIQCVEDHPCYFLWEWNSKNHEWIQKVIVFMKDGNNYELYKLFMKWLLKKTGIDFCHEGYAVAIPSYDRKHPQYLVKVFQEYNPLSTAINVEKNVHSVQKNRKQGERQNTLFKLKESSKRIDYHRSIWVLDDVLVTGGSFKGLLKLFKHHSIKGVFVWAYRSKS